MTRPTHLVLSAASISLLTVASALGAPPMEGLGPTGPVQKVSGMLQFTEGPAADGKGNLYFSDVPASIVYQIDAAGNQSEFRNPSGTSNGNMFNAAGDLVSCEMEGRVIAVSPDGQKVRPLASKFNGQRFNAPNDLVLDSAGGVYFTDPHFRAPMPLPQGVTAVYYVGADGKVARLMDDLKAPNGVILSPDEKTLYVIPSMQADMMAYPVEAPGKVGPGRVFCTLRQAAGQSGRGGDGLTVDEQGNLYITSALGLQVFNPRGEMLGVIEFPEQPANATFGGADGKTLYVTARTSVYSVPMSVKGHVFPGGKK